MKKLTIALITVFATIGVAHAQADKLILEANRKAALEIKKKSDEAIMKKDSLKAKTWLARAEAYLDLANTTDTVLLRQEASSPFKAYEALKKAVSLDVKDGKEGSVAASAKKYLSVVMNKEGKPEPEGQKLFNAFMNVGVQKYQAKDYEGALKNVQMASKINEKDTTSAMYSGVIGQMAKNLTATKEGYKKYLDLGGKDASIFYGLAQIYRDEKDEDKALATIEAGIAKNPSNKDLKNEKINMLLTFKKLDLAIKELEDAVAKDPSNVQTVLNLGILYDNAGKKDLARKYYDQTLKLDPNNYDVNFNMGVFSFNEAVEIKKKVDAMDMKTYQKEGKPIEQLAITKFKEALPYFEKAYGMKQEDECKNTLKSLYQILKMEDKLKSLGD